MIVIIVMAIAVSHLVTYGNRLSEGMKDGEEETEEEDGEETEEEDGEEGFEEEEEEKEEKPKEGMKEKSKDEKPMDVSTSDLLKKQGELMEKMSQLEPLLNRAESLFKTQKTDGFQNMAKSTPFSEYH
jgi:hypothetical protein